MESERIDARTLGMLKWRCRRGMLENDLLIERFFERHAEQLTPRHAAALTQLMDLPDTDLLDLLLRRKEPQGELDTDEVNEVLGLLRRSPPDTKDRSSVSAPPAGTGMRQAFPVAQPDRTIIEKGNVK